MPAGQLAQSDPWPPAPCPANDKKGQPVGGSDRARPPPPPAQTPAPPLIRNEH